MMSILMLLVMTISGGLFAGTILHSFKSLSRFDRALDVYQNFWT